MEPKREQILTELARRTKWGSTAPALVEVLVPAVIAPEDAEWAATLDLDHFDQLRQGFYQDLAYAAAAEEGPTFEAAVLWGSEESQTKRLRRLLGALDRPLGLSVIGEGAVRVKPDRLARAIRPLYSHFGRLELYDLDGQGGAMLYEDRHRPGWFELTVVGKGWVATLQ